MYSDNETEIDLLGFDDQIEDLRAIVLDSTMLPVTVGLLGDWGSGKTSLLRMAATRLRSDGAVVIEFSPWRIESYDDAKSAFLDAVVTAVTAALPPARDELTEGRLASGLAAVISLRKKVRWMRVAALAAKHLVTLSAPSIDELDGLLRDDDSDATTIVTTEAVARDFHREFESLVAAIEAPVIVLIDDLDRCLPEQVLDVLQAIRLFLAVPGTGFVLATDERVVRDAVRLRYPQAAAASETDLPQEYLEKIVQIPIRIPPLGSAQVETYLNLLVSEKHCNSSQIEILRARATEIRKNEYLAVAMNLGIARDCLGQSGVPPAAEHDLEVISRTARLLAMGLKGNPRQIKRFLNMLLLRRATAKRRGVDVDDAVLTKLALLEYAHLRYFQILYTWQSRADGRPPELAEAESSPSGRETPEVAEWVAHPWLKSWLDLEPRLSGIDLNPYFVLARDALDAAAVVTRRLPVPLQKLLHDIVSSAPIKSAAAVKRAQSLPPTQSQLLVEAGLERLPTLDDPAQLALAAVDICADRPDLMTAVLTTLRGLPYERIPAAFPAKLMAALGTQASALLPPLLNAWESQTVSARLSKAAAQVRRRQEGA